MKSIRYHLFCSDQYFCLNDLEATWQQVCKHSCSFKNIVRGWLRFKQQFAVLCVAFIFLLQTTQKLFIFLADMYTRFKTWSSTSKNPSVHSNDWKVEKNWRFSWLPNSILLVPRFILYGKGGTSQKINFYAKNAVPTTK